MLGLLPLLAGCANPPEPGSRPGNSLRAEAVNPFTAVQKGTTAEEVRKLLGEPKEIKPLTNASVAGEVWHYEHKIDAFTQQMGTGTKDVPYVNPKTGTSETRQEVIMSDVHITVYASVDFLLVEGRVIEIKRKQWEDRQVD
jgi:hypothetical protein